VALSSSQKQTVIPPQAVQQPQAPRSRLGAASKGRLLAPSRYFIYGVEGSGKTTLLSYAPDPIWIDADDGTGKLDVTRYQFRDGPDGHVPHHYSEITSAIDDLIQSPHDYKTLVLDTADRIESMIWRHIIDRDNEKVRGEKMVGIEDFGYGRGYVAAVDEWRNLCSRLDRLRTLRGVAIALVGHSFVKNFKNPEGPDFDRYQPALHDKASAFLRGWSDVVGFLRFEEVVNEEKRKRAKGLSTGRRIMHLSRTAAFDAKARGGMPEELEIPVENPWAVISKAESDAANSKVEDIVAQIDAEVTRIGGEGLQAKVKASVDEAMAKGDLAALARYLLALKARPPANANQAV
jgi:hypothetical protein